MNRRTVLTWIRAHWYTVAVVVLVLLAGWLRLVRFHDRWGLAYDQAHDALVARYAIEHGKIPLVGPFSSAGQFQTSGIWYWYIMAASVPDLSTPWTPWYVNAAMFSFFIIPMMYVASRLVDRRFAVLVGTLTALSPAQIHQSVNLTATAPFAYISLFAIASMLWYVRTLRLWAAFCLGLAVGLAPNMQLQGALVLGFLAVVLVFTDIWKPHKAAAVAAGILTASVPFLVYELRHGFFNITNMVRYITVDQYKTTYEALGRRWLTYLTDFIPTEWAKVAGGHFWIAVALMVLVAVSLGLHMRQKQRDKRWTIIAVFTVAILGYMRYARNPLFSSYLVFLHPFILLLSAWGLWGVIRRNRIIGSAAAAVVVISMVQVNMAEIAVADNTTADTVSSWMEQLESRFPGEGLMVYDYEYRSKSLSFPFSLYVEAASLGNPGGRAIGFISATQSAELMIHPSLIGDTGGLQILDLSASPSSELMDAGWGPVDAEHVYEATEEWLNQ